MSLKFSANVNTMFTELPFLDRFDKARNCGFTTIEMQNPYDVEAPILKNHLKGLNVDLINLKCGETRYGCASLKAHEDQFIQTTRDVLPYHFNLNFKKLHILAGHKEVGSTPEDQIGFFVNNLKSLVEHDYLENINVVAVIEPISKETIPNYFLDNYDLAIQIIEALNSNHVKLLLDIYHLHKITGSVEENLERLYPYAGHIQVSQDPGRAEPFIKGGAIDYRYVFDFLRQRNHTDFIGLEYFPSTEKTEDSLKWMQDYI